MENYFDGVKIFANLQPLVLLPSQLRGRPGRGDEELHGARGGRHHRLGPDAAGG